MSPQHCFVESLCIENYIHKNTVLLCNPPKNNNNNHLNFFVCNLYLLYRLRWITILGTCYRLGGVVILSVELVPTFGLISDIIILDVDDYYLVCEPLHTECFLQSLPCL